ncbi:MAG: hypothetical protein IMF18_12120 [Proteobacteria bacterium]|nr:hypothetical protein [Pseudomonadota bacterium]MCD4755397.1 hypothetical protein [Deltaproteobacteria bacterium]
MKQEVFLSRGILSVFLALVIAILIRPCPVFSSDFDRFIMPVSNPVYLGDARNITMLRPIYMYHNLSHKVDTRLGKVPVDGHAEILAVQATYAFNERFSLVAVKDGYVDCDPDDTMHSHSGWADLAAGLQYSFFYKPEKDCIISARLVYELPSGSDDVFQGNGDGNIAPALLFLKGYGDLQFSGTLGFVIPIDKNEENTLFYDAWHLSYAVTSWFHPLIELNHFYVIDSGDREAPSSGVGALGTSKEDDLVAGIAEFNGCDLINLGGKYNDGNRNLVTLALGSRFRVTEWLDFGMAYEFSLTDEEKSMFDDRYTIDAVITLRF